MTDASITEIVALDTNEPRDRTEWQWDVVHEGQWVGRVCYADAGLTSYRVSDIRRGAKPPTGTFLSPTDAATGLVAALRLQDHVKAENGLSVDTMLAVDFETCWPRHTWASVGARASAIRDLTGHSEARHAQLIANAITDPAAWAYAPTALADLRRARDQRIRERYTRFGATA